MTEIVKDEEFWFEDGSLVLLVCAIGSIDLPDPN